MNDDLQFTGVAATDNRIDEICDAYEAAWLRAERPRMDGFLEPCEEAYRAELFYELLLVELEYRRNQGERPAVGEYLRQFPQFAVQIEAANFHYGGTAFATMSGADDDTVRERTHQPGSRVGHFELVERLGAGAMGEVWKAWDTRLRRPVAVKLPRPEALTEADLRRFLREGQAGAQLRHPRLASVHQVGREGNTVYIVADYVEGENLRTYFAAHPLNYVEIAELCAEVAEALHHAHEQEIVHRDLKPANIIVDLAGRPHVIDFGLAKWSNDDRDLTLQGELLGTPAYMSPEQANGDAAKLDRRTDVYSLGVILYEMLVGSCPFIGDRGSVIHQILVRDPAAPRSLERKIPKDLETICTKALEKDPNRRYATMQQMAVDLRRFARGEPILTRRVGLLEKSWRCVSRHPGVAAALVAIIVVAGTSVAIVRALVDKNYEIQGYRPIRLDTSPPGARVAFVPIDNQTGEPTTDPAAVIRPRDRTPVEISLKPGDYLIEAVLPGKDPPGDFVEHRILIPEAGTYLSAEAASRRWKTDKKDLYAFRLNIERSADVLADMVAVPVAESLRRENPLLPRLLYVDARETKPARANENSAPTKSDNRGSWSSYIGATLACQSRCKRLPSAAEYEAIVQAVKANEIVDATTGKPAKIDDLFRGAAEWTTTKYHFDARGRPELLVTDRRCHELAGYGDPDKLPGLKRTPDNKLIAPPDLQSPFIGFRGVRSGAPRFLAE